MNIKNRLRHLAMISTKDRMTGRTSRLIKTALDIGGIFLANSLEAAKLAERKNKGLVARSIETNLEGYSGPFVFDHFAVETMFLKGADKIESLETELAMQKARHEQLRAIDQKAIDSLVEIITRKEREIIALRDSLSFNEGSPSQVRLMEEANELRKTTESLQVSYNISRTIANPVDSEG